MIFLFLRDPLSSCDSREHVSRMTSCRRLASSQSRLSVLWFSPFLSLFIVIFLFHSVSPNLSSFQLVSLSFLESGVFLEHSKNHDGTRCRFLSSTRMLSFLLLLLLSYSLCAGINAWTNVEGRTNFKRIASGKSACLHVPGTRSAKMIIA